MSRPCTCEVACNGHRNAATYEIAEYLEVPINIADSVHDIIDTYFYLDWSECDSFEKRATILAAYEFYKTQQARTRVGFSTALRQAVDIPEFCEIHHKSICN